MPLLLGAGQGRSSDWQAELLYASSTGPSSHLFRDSDFRVFVPAYRCGAVPDSHRVPFSTRRFKYPHVPLAIFRVTEQA